MAIGPLAGSILGVDLMWIVFLSAGLASFAACVPAYLVTEHRPDPHGGGGAPRHRHVHLVPAITGSLLAAVVLGCCFGTYEICWTLLLKLRGASSWQIGLSWTLFSVPFVLMTRPSGWLTDHTDRRRLVVGGLVVTTSMCATYPFLHSVPLLLVLGGVEAVATVLVLPAAQSMLVQTAAPTQLGQVQGLFSTSQTAATAVGAAVGGALFAVAAWTPFVLMSSIGFALVVVIAVVWRSVPGKVAPAA